MGQDYESNFGFLLFLFTFVMHTHVSKGLTYGRCVCTHKSRERDVPLVFYLSSPRSGPRPAIVLAGEEKKGTSGTHFSIYFSLFSGLTTVTAEAAALALGPEKEK